MWDHTIVIGAYLDQSVGSKSGSAFIFKLVGGKWKEKQKLSSMLSSSADYFGQDVGIHENHVVVGAYGMEWRREVPFRCLKPWQLIAVSLLACL